MLWCPDNPDSQIPFCLKITLLGMHPLHMHSIKKWYDPNGRELYCIAKKQILYLTKSGRCVDFIPSSVKQTKVCEEGVKKTKL